MSENDTTPKSSSSTGPRMKDGEEPTEVLLALASSPLLALQKRGLVKIATAKNQNGSPVVVALFSGASWSDSVGIVVAMTVPTEPKVLAGEL